MTLEQFLDKYNGQYCEVAGSADAKNQCVDLANAYLRDVLSQPIVEWTNAIDFPSKLTGNFDYILNTPTGIPQEGDLMISGVSYGHIGIFLEGDANRFTSFDENYPTGSFCTVVEHNYNSPKVHGWLRFKKDSIPDSAELTACKTQVADEIKKKNETYNELQEVKQERDGLKSQVQTYDGLMIQYSNLLGCEKEPTIIAGKISELVAQEDDFRKATKQVQDLTLENTNLDNELQVVTKDKSEALGAVHSLTDKLKTANDKLDKLSPLYTPIFKITTKFYLCKKGG
jgi:regulator of replication initiation timing